MFTAGYKYVLKPLYHSSKSFSRCFEGVNFSSNSNPKVFFANVIGISFLSSLAVLAYPLERFKTSENIIIFGKVLGN